MIGTSHAFQQVLRLIERIARYIVPAMIYGETGTGKELAARAIHYGGPRRERPFLPINCGAIPDTLIENELFGHDRGAFTDAQTRSEGVIACAHGGTLFLDEVDALTPKAQVTLLRFLQDHKYRPLGSERDRQADVRIIAATNSDLRQLCAEGRFRLDLYYRLCIMELRMPPLREREGDAALLCAHFVEKFSRQHGQPQRQIAAETLQWFDEYGWPGNVRELENIICRAVLLASDDSIKIEPPPGVTARHSNADLLQLGFAKAKALSVERFERQYLEGVLARAKGNVTLAARLAGKERRAFGKLMKKHSLNRTRYRSET